MSDYQFVLLGMLDYVMDLVTGSWFMKYGLLYRLDLWEREWICVNMSILLHMNEKGKQKIYIGYDWMNKKC